MENNKLNAKHALITVGCTIFALVLGLYIGFNESGQALASRGLQNDAPEDVDLKQFWEVWNLINERHPSGSKIDSQEKIWGAIKGMVESVGDPYTVFLPPAENNDLKIDLKGKFSGVGMEVGKRNGAIAVIAPLKNSPAEKAGILPGDYILKIGETLVSGLDVDQAVDLIRGKEGTPVTITILREGEDSAREVTIVREIIKIPVTETKYIQKDGVFVISLFSFGEESAREFSKALDEFVDSGAKKLVIDLRNNPGGYLSAAVDISSWFLEEGKIVVSEHSIDPKLNKDYRSNGHFLKGNYKIAILVNGGSASASEIMAGALQEHGVAKLVGAQTFGKGSVQELMPMEEDTALKITIAEWLTPKGHSISKQGLTPDVPVEFDEAKFQKDGTDTQLQKAIEILK